MGFSVGLLWFFMMVSYGVGLKFGAYLIGDDREVISLLRSSPHTSVNTPFQCIFRPLIAGNARVVRRPSAQ